MRTIMKPDVMHKLKTSMDDIGYGSAIGYSAIRITPNYSLWTIGGTSRGQMYADDNKDDIVIGIMLEPFSYSLGSNWSNDVESIGVIGMKSVTESVQYAGFGDLGSYYKSKKVWQSSEALKITPKMRVIDTDGNGQPLKVAAQLLRWATAVSKDDAKYRFDLSEKVDSIAASIAEGIKTLGDIGSQAVRDSIAKALEEKMNGNGNGQLDFSAALYESLNSATIAYLKSAMEDFSSQFELKLSPPPLNVEIGKIFYHQDMVLTSVHFQFSREVSRKGGPLYVDIDITLETRKIIRDFGDVGLLETVNDYVVDNTPDDSYLQEEDTEVSPPPYAQPGYGESLKKQQQELQDALDSRNFAQRAADDKLRMASTNGAYDAYYETQ